MLGVLHSRGCEAPVKAVTHRKLVKTHGDPETSNFAQYDNDLYHPQTESVGERLPYTAIFHPRAIFT